MPIYDVTLCRREKSSSQCQLNIQRVSAVNAWEATHLAINIAAEDYTDWVDATADNTDAVVVARN
jgi:hypothetical protein